METTSVATRRALVFDAQRFWHFGSLGMLVGCILLVAFNLNQIQVGDVTMTLRALLNRCLLEGLRNMS